MVRGMAGREFPCCPATVGATKAASASHCSGPLFHLPLEGGEREGVSPDGKARRIGSFVTVARDRVRLKEFDEHEK
jgi:hypothetical protein